MVNIYSLSNTSTMRERFDGYYERVRILYPESTSNLNQLCFWEPEYHLIQEESLSKVLEKLFAYLENVSHAFGPGSKITTIALFELRSTVGEAYVLFAVENEFQIVNMLDVWWTKQAKRFATEEYEKRLKVINNSRK